MKGRSYASRFQETKKLLDYGFINFERKELYPAGYQVPAQTTIKVKRGRVNQLEIATAEALSILIRRGEEAQYQPQVELKAEQLTAPVPAGHVVGELIAAYHGNTAYDYLTPEGPRLERVPLVTTEKVEKAGFLRLIFQSITAFFAWLAQQIRNLF
jgi:D-alanyl-D-alanine carboxypeptidase (penicillin-binding protein 5/6)